MTLTQANKYRAAQEVQAALVAIDGLHRHSFPPMERPTAPAAQPVDIALLRTRMRKQNLIGIGAFARTARKTAKAEADQASEALAELQKSERVRVRDEQQKSLDAWWEELLHNDPAITTQFINQAFEDNAAAAAVVSIDGSAVSIVVVVPDESTIPDRVPTTTASGNLSLKKMTKTEQATWYREVICGHTMVTIREAFAVAPGIASVSIVAIRSAAPSAFGKTKFDALLAAQFRRNTLTSVQWDTTSASTVAHDASDELIINYRGSAQTITPIDLTKQPELARLIAAIDFDDLT